MKNFDATCSSQFGQKLAILKKEPLSNLCATVLYLKPFFLNPYKEQESLIIGQISINATQKT